MDIAIIGMAGVFPEAPDIDTFFKNLSAGRDSIRPLSLKRIQQTTLPQKDYQVLAWIENIDYFDHSFFLLSLGEAQMMDPHQRLSLQVAYQALENAGYSLEKIKGTATGVYIGHSQLNYYQHATEYDANLLTGNLPAALSGRISRFFDLHGPSMMIDTSCSSSLTAVHLACNSIASGESTMALVCGVKLMLFPPPKVNEYGDIGIESPDGKVRSFSADANGSGGGETITAVLLKPLNQAIHDGDIIHAVIKGSAINQDAARSGSLTSPSSQAQAEVIKLAWKRSGIDPRAVSFIEAHGTATKLGDPIEIDGIGLAFREYTNDKKFCAISSVKSNIGHTDSAAGLVGLIKAVLSLKFKKLFPAVNFSSPNPFIDFDSSPVFVNTQFSNWVVPAGEKRIAGVSSFGLSGTNCHVVLEEGLENQVTHSLQADNNSYLFTLSARSSYSLVENVRALYTFLQDKEINSRDLSFTLNTCRSQFGYRIAFVAASIEELSEQLFQFLEENSDKIFTGSQSILLAFSQSNQFLKERTMGFYQNFQEFAFAYDECVRFANSEDLENHRFYDFSFQYALYKLIEANGVHCKNFIGHGIGDGVTQVLAGKKTLQQGIAEACRLKDLLDDSTFRTSVVRLKNKLTNEKTFVVSMCPDSVLISTLQEEGFDNEKIISLKKTENQEREHVSLLALLYSLGVQIDWTQYHQKRKGTKIELPGYCFDVRRCWLKEPEKKNDVQYYHMSWHPSPTKEHSNNQNKVVILFMSDNWSSQQVALTLQDHHHVVMIRQGDAFRRNGENEYSFNWSQQDQYQQLFDELRSEKVKPDVFIHLGACDQSNDYQEKQLFQGIYSYFFLFKSFHKLLVKSNVSFFAWTKNARQIDQQEITKNPLHATAHGFAASLSEEYPQLTIRAIDVDDDSYSDLANLVKSEMEQKDDKVNVAYRKRIRYLPEISLRKSHLSQKKKSSPTSGLYLVCGGGSGIGYQIVKHLALKKDNKIIVFGRRDKITDLEFDPAENGNIFYFKIDISNQSEVHTAIESVTNRFGPLSGVVNAAGLPGGTLIKDHSFQSFAEVLRPKLMGTINLFEAIRYPLEFFLTCSSIDAFIGAARNTNYSAANMFLDNFVTVAGTIHKTSIAVNWPGWKETGMLYRMTQKMKLEFAPDCISNVDGIRAFEDLISSDTGQIIVSKFSPSSIGENKFFSFASNNMDEKSLWHGKESSDSNLSNSNGISKDYKGIRNFIKQIWSSILKQELIEDDHDFFELGGHSLSGIQMINSLKKEFGIQMELDELFESATLVSLTALILTKVSEGQIADPLISDLRPTELQMYYGLSHAQKRIWFLQQMDKANTAYNMFAHYIIEGRPDLSALEWAYKKLVERHESLRTVFFLHDGEPKQRVLPYSDKLFHIRFENRSGKEDFNQVIEEETRREAIIPFSMDGEVLFRTKLVQPEINRALLLFSIHHSISDGWSINILIRDFFQFYLLYKNPHLPPLNPLSLQYKDYTIWHMAYMSDPAKVRRHKEYWIQKLKPELSRANLTTDFKRPEILTYNGNHFSIDFEEGLLARLKQFCLEHELTLFTLLLATIKILLHKYCGEGSIAVGVSAAGRDHKDLENQVGFYINTLVIQDNIFLKDHVNEVINKVRQSLNEAQQNAIYPFDLLVQDLELNRELNRNPLFDIEVNMMEDIEIGESIVADKEVIFKPYQGKSMTSIFDLSFNFVKEKENLSIDIRYNTDLFMESTLRIMSTRLEIIMKNVIEGNNMCMDEIDLKLASELEKTSRIKSILGFEESF